MIAVVAAIIVATAVGVASERRWGDGAQRVNRHVITALLWTVLPFICFFTIARRRSRGPSAWCSACAWSSRRRSCSRSAR